MSHYDAPMLPDTAQVTRVQCGRSNPHHDSRLFGQIVPLAPPVQVMGGMPDPISPSIPTSISLRWSAPVQPSTYPVTIPGFVSNPQTPENPRVYPVSPHPRLIHAETIDTQPIFTAGVE